MDITLKQTLTKAYMAYQSNSQEYITRRNTYYKSHLMQLVKVADLPDVKI